jgi:hypothetical protein
MEAVAQDVVQAAHVEAQAVAQTVAHVQWTGDRKEAEGELSQAGGGSGLDGGTTGRPMGCVPETETVNATV